MRCDTLRSMRSLLIALALLPASTFALDYTDASLLYADAPFRPAEAAGISLLSNLEAVQGNPDGTFRPDRTLNRAEFLKIAIASFPDIRVGNSDAGRCFPDVREDDWFSPYVCLAKKRKIIGGYPDGTFGPGRPVNYAEALKILGELYRYTAYTEPDAPWYQIYVQAAQNHKTILPVQIPYDGYITRGQMARLAAAYRAEHEEELDLYRLAEKGEYIAPIQEQREHDQRIAQRTQDLLATLEEQEQKAELSQGPDLPTRTRHLLLGTKTDSIADFVIFPREHPVQIKIVKVVFDKQVKTIDTLMLVDEAGVEIGELVLDPLDGDRETWKLLLEEDASSYVLPGKEGTTFALIAQIKPWGNGGFSGDRFKVKSVSFSVTTADEEYDTYQIVPSKVTNPIQTTVQAILKNVESLEDDEGELLAGSDLLLGRFRFTSDVAVTLDRAVLTLEHLRFHIVASEGVSVTGMRLINGDGKSHPCSFEGSDRNRVNCLALDPNFALVDGEHTFELRGDISTSGSPDESLQVNLIYPGSLSDSGDIRWSDGAGHFIWVDLPEPLAQGILYQR